MLAAFGYPVNSLLSDEGLRWIFRNAISNLFSPIVCGLIILIGSIDSVWEVVVKRVFHSLAAFKVFVGVFGVFAFVLWLSVSSGSPLLNVVGGILPHSPLLFGFPLLLSFFLWSWCFIYVLITNQLHSINDFTGILCVALSRRTEWIVCILLLSYNIHLIHYML